MQNRPQIIVQSAGILLLTEMYLFGYNIEYRGKTSNVRIDIYKTANGKEPYVEWLESLDRAVRARIKARLTRIQETSNLGIHEPVGDGIFELKFDFGPGYRVYFGFKTDTFLILLFGGNKKGQQRDIDKAKEYWRDHLSLKRGKK
jgi:putative addiction module killer protein